MRKIELKKQLARMGIKVLGNYIRKRDVELATIKKSKTKIKTKTKTKNITLDQLNLEKWLKETKTKPTDWEKSWDLSDDQLGISEEEHTDEDGKFNEKEYLKDYEYAVHTFISNKFDECLDRYKSFKYPLTLYRGVKVESWDDIDFNNIGECWTTDINAADCYDDHKVKVKKSQIFVLKADVSKDDIDWLSTVSNNLNPSFGDDEQEVDLIKGRKIKVMSDDDENGENFIGTI
jgi:hypothetical protein